MLYVHPSWNGNVEDGYDVAPMRLPREINIPAPSLPDSHFSLYPNLKIYGFRLRNLLEVAQFKVVANAFCPYLRNIGNSTFCAFSRSAKMDSGKMPILAIMPTDHFKSKGTDLNNLSFPLLSQSVKLISSGIIVQSFDVKNLAVYMNHLI